MTLTLELKPEIEQGLLARAQGRGLSLDVYLEEVLTSLTNVDDATMIEDGSQVDIPLLPLGVRSPMRRFGIHSDSHNARPRYTLDELLAQCDPNAPLTEEEREWLDAKPVGHELI